MTPAERAAFAAGAEAMRSEVSARFRKLPPSYPTRHQWAMLVAEMPLPTPAGADDER